jgi:hypothetical protein
MYRRHEKGKKMAKAQQTLENEIDDLKRRVALLEEMVARRTQADDEGTHPLEQQDDLIGWLHAEGLIVEPPPAAWIHARRWHERPDAETRKILRELDHLPPGPMASDIVIGNRR